MKREFVSQPECANALGRILDASAERQATRHFKNHIPRLSWAFALVPVAKSADEKLLDIGSKLDIIEIFREIHGYRNLGGSVYAPDGIPFREISANDAGATVYHFDGERHLIPCEPGTYDVVTCFEVIEHMTSDPVALLANINRALAMGGFLVLTTVNCASLKSLKKILLGRNPFLYGHFNLNLSANRHNKEYTARELIRTVKAGGFEIVKVIAPFVFSDDDPEFTEKLKQLGCDTKYLGDDTMILARKISNDVVRFPSHLYVGGDDEYTVPSCEVFSKARQVSGQLRKARKEAHGERPAGEHMPDGMHLD